MVTLILVPVNIEKNHFKNSQEIQKKHGIETYDWFI